MFYSNILASKLSILITLTELELFSNFVRIGSAELEEDPFCYLLDSSFCEDERLMFQHRVDVQPIDRHHVHVRNLTGSYSDVLRNDVSAGRVKD